MMYSQKKYFQIIVNTSSRMPLRAIDHIAFSFFKKHFWIAWVITLRIPTRGTKMQLSYFFIFFNNLRCKLILVHTFCSKFTLFYDYKTFI